MAFRNASRQALKILPFNDWLPSTARPRATVMLRGWARKSPPSKHRPPLPLVGRHRLADTHVNQFRGCPALRRVPGLALALLLAAGPTPGHGADADPGGGQRRPLAVTVAKAEKTELTYYVRAEGVARARRREILEFNRSGRVAHVGTDADGDPLREGSKVSGPDADGDGKGTLIAALAGGDLAQTVAARKADREAARERVQAAEAGVQNARDRLATARKKLKRVKKLVDEGTMPKKRLEAARGEANTARDKVNEARSNKKAAKADAEAAAARYRSVLTRLEEGTLRAPFDGIIALRNVSRGEHVTPLPGGLSEAQRLRRAPAVVIDPGSFEIVARVPWSRAARLKRGQKALVAWAGMGLFRKVDARRANGRSLDGLPVARARVWAVAPAVLPDTRTVRVRLRTRESTPDLRDGVFVTARVATHSRSGVLAVPRGAVRQQDGKAYVYVVDRDAGVAHRRQVRVGRPTPRRVPVKNGLKAGETVVVRGQGHVADGMPVDIVNNADDA